MAAARIVLKKPDDWFEPREFTRFEGLEVRRWWARSRCAGAMLCESSIEESVPADHALHDTELFLDLTGTHPPVAPFDSKHGGPSIDPKLMIWMQLLGGLKGIRSECRHCK